MHTVGAAAHAAATDALLASYAALGPGDPVRLAKRTSNLFRPRDATRAPGLDVRGLGGVVSVDPAGRTADVQGMCTYEDLVDVTLAHGLIPLVVPQLRTITLGGAVTGLGIESTSFRNGLPHESVLEMDVLTGAGEIVTATADNEHADLFAAFPNSYGSLGYATRLRIALEPVPAWAALRHVRFDDAHRLVEAVEEIVATRRWEGERVDGLDGVAFAPDELYLTLARWTNDPAGARPSTYVDEIYFRSVQERATDLLGIADYLWRWDTDWFWCSGAFGLHDPRVRRLWPASKRRSDVYHRLVALERRHGVVDRIDRWRKRPQRERVIQDVEVPAERLPEFLSWFDEHVGMRPVWLCPLRLREPDGPGSGRTWTAYPLEAGRTYVNAGFWGTVPVGPEAPDAPVNRAVEQRVHELDGHKSLYSEAFYDPETFDRLYDGPALARVKETYDPDQRLSTLYAKAVRRQ
ncbi:FAD-binding oxidoreductase [Nocardioides zeae]|uniref:Delta(24)-sterol reductase n=1 Tax=Nocardioides imazamoxiresistens TaxID=3231893 RepID=A0ABU3Q145_9ACTN|nr:FAD-binding oxidoreductase [Nocardioides zeae]MDT9595228.1 FAD-binding oxidoreductase [Nocardioides zeae]